MLGFGAWGYPEHGDTNKLRINDRVRIKSRVPFRSGEIGVLIDITSEGDYMVAFADEQVIGYDSDELIRLN